jgi:hypothetical protein
MAVIESMQKELYPELEQNCAKVEKTVGDFARDTYGFRPDFQGVEVIVKEQPTIYTLLLKRVGDYVKAVAVPIGKALGVYKPQPEGLNRIELDPTADRNVAMHEYLHYLQDCLGAIKRVTEALGQKARSYLEGGATYATERVTGKNSGVYPRERAAFAREVERVGLRRAFAYA